MIHDQLQKFEEEEARKEAIEHRDVLLSIASIIRTNEGQKLFKYLFKNWNATTLPERNLDDKDLYEALGFHRAGNSLYTLACEACSETAALIAAKLEREKYDNTYERFRIENGLNTSDRL